MNWLMKGFTSVRASETAWWWRDWQVTDDGPKKWLGPWRLLRDSDGWR